MGDNVSKAKLVRQDLGITQIELSIETEIPRYKIQLIDQGIPCLTCDEAERLTLALGKHPDRMPRWIKCLVKEGEQWRLY